MKKTKRVLSMLLVVVSLFGIVSVLVSSPKTYSQRNIKSGVSGMATISVKLKRSNSILSRGAA